MFEISELKAKTLADLQVIAKSIGLSKTSQLKKLDLVYQILDTQAASPSKEGITLSKAEGIKMEKPKRKRVIKTPQSESRKATKRETEKKEDIKPFSEKLKQEKNTKREAEISKANS
jgi:transcription termination factor Rho